MAEGFDLYSVCLSERQMARITSALARNNRGNAAAAENDATIFEMFRHAKPLQDGSPPKVKFYRCASTTAEGLMRACIDAMNGAVEEETLDLNRFNFFKEVFDAAQKYYLSDLAESVAYRMTQRA